MNLGERCGIVYPEGFNLVVAAVEGSECGSGADEIDGSDVVARTFENRDIAFNEYFGSREGIGGGTACEIFLRNTFDGEVAGSLDVELDSLAGSAGCGKLYAVVGYRGNIVGAIIYLASEACVYNTVGIVHCNPSFLRSSLNIAHQAYVALCTIESIYDIQQRGGLGCFGQIFHEVGHLLSGDTVGVYMNPLYVVVCAKVEADDAIVFCMQLLENREAGEIERCNAVGSDIQFGQRRLLAEYNIIELVLGRIKFFKEIVCAYIE